VNEILCKSPGCALLSYVKEQGRCGLWATRTVHKRTPRPLQSLPFTSLRLDTCGSSVMGHGQPSQRNSHVTDNRRVTEGGVVILGHTGYPSPGIVGGRDPQQRAPHRPSTSSMSGPSSFWPPGNSSIYSPITEKGETARNMVSYSAPWSPAVTDPSFSRDPYHFIPLYRRLHYIRIVPHSRLATWGSRRTAGENLMTAPPKHLAAQLI